MQNSSRALILMILLIPHSAVSEQAIGITRYRVSAVGRLAAQSEARHLIAHRDGIIDDLYVSEGHSVKAGDVLASISCNLEEAKLDVARAQLEVSRAELALVRASPRKSDLQAASALLDAQREQLSESESTYRRLRGMSRERLVSEQDLETAYRRVQEERALVEHLSASMDRVKEGPRIEEIQIAEARLQMHVAMHREAEASVEHCLIRSPVDGDILRIFRHPGEASGSSSGEPILVVADVSKMVVKAEIDEMDAASVQIGDAAEIWINGKDYRAKGSVTGKASMAGRRTARTYDPADRFDREVVEVTITYPSDALPRIVDMRVTVGIL